MKKIKKMFAVMLSLAMVLGMAMTVSASGADPTGTTKYPSKEDKGNPKVEGLAKGDVVNFYKIVESDYQGTSFVGYKVVDTFKDLIAEANKSAPTAEEVTAVANAISATHVEDYEGTVIDAVATKTAGNDGIVIAEGLPVGIYLVQVTAADPKIVYNPMIVSVYYRKPGSDIPSGDTDINGVVAGSVSAGEDFVVGETHAYAKRTDVDIKKTILSPLESDENNKGNDQFVGKDVNFQIVTDVPSYSDEYTTVKYEITDDFVGLEMTEDNYEAIQVYLDGVLQEVDGKNYTITPKRDGTGESARIIGYTISFDSTYIKNLGKTPNGENKFSHKFYVLYTAKISNDAKVNFDANSNTAKLTYTHKPGDDTNTIEDKTYHYTFEIDGLLNGEGSYQTGELFKSDEGDGTITQLTEKITYSNPLPGAKFQLEKIDVDGNSYRPEVAPNAWKQEKTSGSDGRLSFTGLDAGYYVLKEIEAPQGYSLNTDEYVVEILASYDTEGRMTSYKINIYPTIKATDGTITIDRNEDKVMGSTYTATYTKNDNGEVIITADHTKDQPTVIKNTKLGNLPSTGGIGTTIFTIGGCAIMIIAAGLFFASRRKSSKDAPKEG